MNNIINKKMLVLVSELLIVLSFISCSTVNVEPWERDVLSKKEMKFSSHKVNQAMQTHFYYSKEGSSGGSGFSGGGCGCN